jgi:hypothetical protein
MSKADTKVTTPDGKTQLVTVVVKTNHPKSKYIRLSPLEEYTSKTQARLDAKSIMESNPTWEAKVTKL